MIPDPLHPAVVHFPVVLAVLLPAVALAVLWWGRRQPRRAWGITVALAALLAASAWAAVQTGEAQEDRVEAVVAEAPFESHEHAAERFLVAALITLAVVGLGLVPGAAGGAARIAGTVATVALLGFGWYAGHTGGQLVYRHGAAAAYASAAPAAGTGDLLAPARRTRDDEDDD